MNSPHKLAPILLFVYNRIDCLEKSIGSVKKAFLADESELIIYADCARNEEDEKKVALVREYVKKINGFKNITIFEQSQNLGLAKSIILGVTETLNKYDKVIVLEDDIIVSPYFLKYMNSALDLYENSDTVVNINAYIPDSPLRFKENFMVSYISSLGWATWRRGWELFEENGEKLLEIIQKEKREKEFNLGWRFTQMLKDQIAGKNNSWAIRWNASVFVNNKTSYTVNSSIVKHIGNGEDATHCKTIYMFPTELYSEEIIPSYIENHSENKKARAKLRFNFAVRTSKINKLRLYIALYIKRFFAK